MNRASALVERPRAPRDEVLAGLRATPKRLTYRLLPDARAAELRELIMGLDDYYPARTELRLFDAQLPAIAAEVGISARVLEVGGSVAIRTRRLMRVLDHPASYIGIDPCPDALDYTAQVLRREFPALDVQSIVADYTLSFTLPAPRRPLGRTLVYVPGTTIDSFEPFAAVALLGALQRIAQPTGRLLIGADGTRDREALLRAYDDRDGLTGELAKRALVPLGLPLDAFAHRAVWNDRYSRVELHLVSSRDQRVLVTGHVVGLAGGEPIVTAHAYKHDLHAMRGLLLSAGWQVRSVFTAEEQPMRLWLCEPRGG